jgi:hypothetical protein
MKAAETQRAKLINLFVQAEMAAPSSYMDWESRLRRICPLGKITCRQDSNLMLGRVQPLRASDDRRERGEGRRRWDPRERGTRETRATPRLRTNFEVSIQPPSGRASFPQVIS